jgi:type III pantothenate kinase
MDAFSSLLAIDVGNTNVVFGYWAGDSWKHVWRLPTLDDQETEEFYDMRLIDFLLEADIPRESLRRIVMSSVVPGLNKKLQKVVRHLFAAEPLLLGPEVYPQLGLAIEKPRQIGTDLVANSLAACNQYKQDLIIVDFGTALTFTSVTKSGQILGVAIAPGLKTAANVLFRKTAQLPEVPLELPASAVGKDTVHAIQSGVLIGYVGLVRHMIRHLREELGDHYGVIATGGLSSVLSPLREDFDHINPYLTLDGLRICAEKCGL